MTLTTAAPASVTQGWQACGCGEDRIPGLLARIGFYGTVGLGLAALVVMIAAGWVLGAGVWLLRRRRDRAAPAEEQHLGPLESFTWTADDTH